jgi:hypothetical protein
MHCVCFSPEIFYSFFLFIFDWLILCTPTYYYSIVTINSSWKWPIFVTSSFCSKWNLISKSDVSFFPRIVLKMSSKEKNTLIYMGFGISHTQMSEFQEFWSLFVEIWLIQVFLIGKSLFKVLQKQLKKNSPNVQLCWKFAPTRIYVLKCRTRIKWCH